MILRRLHLKGFLSFREPQEIVFGDAPVWMLAGPNGSGKSSVFDALTFALFSAHRGGKQNAEELINKDSDSFLIEIDLELGPIRYRVRRTLSRGGKSTRQVLRHEPSGSLDAESDGSWAPVPGTERDDGLKGWVRENLGLTYESFTSSVLLTQGGAERLISAAPTERLVVLKGIVGVDRYERLQRSADDRRKGLEAQAEAARRRLEGLVDPGDEARAEAAEAVVMAEAAREAARDESERLTSLSHQATRWAEVRSDLAEVTRKIERARGILSDAESIARERDRLAELRGVVPRLEAVHAHRQSLEEAERKGQGLEAERNEAEFRLREARSRAEAARERLAELRRGIDADGAEERELSARLRELSALVARLDVFEGQAKEIAKIEQALAAATGGDDLDAARAERDRLETMAMSLPVLDGLVRATEDARAATIAKEGATRTEEGCLRDGPVLRAEQDELKRQAGTAATALRTAEARAVAARTMLTIATERHDRAAALAQAATCDHCGQPLTPEHLREERARRAAALRSAEAELYEADNHAKAAGREEKALRERFEGVTARLNDARERLRAARADRVAAESRIASASAAIDRAIAELPVEVRDAARSQPSERLASCRAEAAGLAAARKRVAKAEEARRKQETLREQLQSAISLRDAQAALLPAAPEGLRAESAGVESRHIEVARRANSRVADRDRAESEASNLARAIESAEASLGRIAAEASGISARRESAAAAVAHAVAALPEAWRELANGPLVFARELRELEAKDIPARAEALRLAQAEMAHLESRRDELDRQAEAIPEAARVSPTDLAARLADARKRLADAESAALSARHEAERLDRLREDRARLAEEKLALDAQAATAASLARLLGPRGLQRHLVRRAERDVIRFANERLDRLSGGSLSLRLRPRAEGETDETALDLEAHDRRTRRSVAVAFLSGSQRFRVAVALALAIGRLAASNSRPIESVIIDEGFGCLDREGRQVMIRELRNLGRGVRRVLLVSHQEEFADAFPDGCRLALEDGATVVSPLSP